MMVTVAQKRNSKQSSIKGFFCISQSVSQSVSQVSQSVIIYFPHLKYLQFLLYNLRRIKVWQIISSQSIISPFIPRGH